jgi:hypothetical protein
MNDGFSDAEGVLVIPVFFPAILGPQGAPNPQEDNHELKR